MALTAHQKLHLNAILKEQEDDKKNAVMMNKRSTVKGKTLAGFNTYLDDVKTEVNKILTTGIWPSRLRDPSDIHDFLEKDIVK